jgi:ribosomal protein S17
MFKKPLDTYKLLSLIRSDENFADDAVIEVEPLACLNKEVECICEAWLAQILLNSLSASSSRFKQFHFCNLTGALLLIPDFNGKNSDYIDAAKVTIDKNYLMNIEIVRHRKLVSVLTDLKNKKIKPESIKYKPRYVISDGTKTFRRWLSEEKPDAKKTYLPLKLEGKKAHTEFLHFGSSADYNKSRAGIFHHVLESVNQNLSSYMKVELSELDAPYTIELKETILKTPKQLHSKLEGKSIRIVDRVDSDESHELSKDLKSTLLNYVTDTKQLSFGKNDKKDSLNVRIIHDKDYYETNGLEDEHLLSTNEFQRQHLTVEGIKEISKAIVKTTIKEILIKRDITKGKLTLFDWCKLNALHSWTFAMYDDNSRHVIFMIIYPDGTFEFKELDGNNILEFTEYQEYLDLIDQHKRDEWKKDKVLEGLVISENGDKNLIFRTNEITIPDLDKISKIIGEVGTNLPDGIKTGKNLALVVEQCFAEINESENDNVCALISELRKINNQELSKTDFRKLSNEYLAPTSKLGRYFRDYLFEQHDIRLHFSKSKDIMDNLFDASLNVNYFMENDSEAYYFVGQRRESIQSSLKDSCHLRKIVSDKDSKLVFKDILKTMDVDFVRTGQSTVLPFPFKYLREYCEFKERNTN